MTTPRRIWVTRTQPEAGVTAARLTAIGFIPVVAPVLAARPIHGVALDLTGVDALAYTSGHAITAFTRLSPERSLPVFAVGETTAALARAAGFTDVNSADGDVLALADHIASAVPQPSCVLNPTAKAAAGDLVALLAERGVIARVVAVYQTDKTDAAPALDTIDAILVHSPKAARRLAALIAGRREAARIDAYAISAGAAAPLEGVGLRSVTAAARPTEAALLGLLKP